MAMNKKEKALVEALKTKAAFHRTEEVKPDVPAPSGYERGVMRMTKGYLPVAPMSDMSRIELACSTSVSHGTGSQDKTSSQGARHLYSTRMLALKRMRWEVEQDCMKRLRRVDRMMEEEQARLDAEAEQADSEGGDA